MQGSTFLCTFAPDLQTKNIKNIMTTQEKQVMLAFLQEQQHYNESLTAFCQYLCNITTTPSDTVPSASADGSSTTDPSPI